MTANRTKQVSVVMIITVISKVLGFLRDIVLARYFGAGSVTDAYFVAQTIPESLFSLVVQAISIGFIPIYTQLLHNKGDEQANRFVDSILKLSLILCVFLVTFVNLFPKYIVAVFASGFDSQTTQYAITFVRISVFAMFFRITVAIYTAYLQSNEQFTVPAFNGVILDVVSILTIILAYYTKSIILVWGIIGASFIQFIALFPSVRKLKPIMSFSLKNIISEEVRQMLILFIPVAIGVGANQLNVIADRTMSSSIQGAISSLNYANKVDNVLENIIILSLATVMFPAFSKNIAANNIDAFKRNVSKSIDVVSFTMLPCTVFAMMFSSEIIRLLFGRGAFDATAINNSAIAMKYYSIGLLCLSYNAIFTRAFYALKKVKLVSIVSCGTLATNVAMNFLLKPIMGIGGLALATSISNIITTLLLVFLLSREIKKNVLKDIITELLKMFVASIVMFLVTYFMYKHLALYYIVSMAIAVITGTIAYLFICYIVNSSIMKELMRNAVSKIKTIRRS